MPTVTRKKLKKARKDFTKALPKKVVYKAEERTPTDCGKNGLNHAAGAQQHWRTLSAKLRPI
ncbi:MAG: hypothetical protein L0Y56_13095 [Nitrospira sp.]|nr:hypothetical protein [Nitrospira sp.]